MAKKKGKDTCFLKEVVRKGVPEWERLELSLQRKKRVSLNQGAGEGIPAGHSEFAQVQIRRGTRTDQSGDEKLRVTEAGEAGWDHITEGLESRLGVRAVDSGSWAHDGATMALGHRNEAVKSQLQEANRWPGEKGGGRRILGRGAREKGCRGPSGGYWKTGQGQERWGWKEGLGSDIDSNQMGGVGGRERDACF